MTKKAWDGENIILITDNEDIVEIKRFKIKILDGTFLYLEYLMLKDGSHEVGWTEENSIDSHLDEDGTTRDDYKEVNLLDFKFDKE